jgi:2-polyprenyl-3-methyl-5-hydroxy-6-metoxy-1,4-benzoquinol methylase
LLDAGMSVAASDLSPESLLVVKNKYGTRENFKGAFKIDELSSSGLLFDAVVLVELVEHVDDDILREIFNNVKQVLSPGGAVIVTCPNDENLSVETVYCPCCDHTFHRWQHVRSWSKTTLNELFLSQGLFPVLSMPVDFSLNPADGRLRYWIKRLLYWTGKRRFPHLIGVARSPSASHG